MDQEIISLLKDFLTEAEITVYFTLLKKGPLSATKIVSETDLNRSNLYKVLNNLAKKKLVSEITLENKKYFVAGDPYQIKKLFDNNIKTLEKRGNALKELILSLQQIQNVNKIKKKTEFGVSIYSGVEEMKSALNLLLTLNKGETEYGIGYAGLFDKIFPEFWEAHKRKRVAKKIYFKGVLKMEEPRKPRHKATYVKYANFKQPANIRIDFFRDITIIFIIEETPKAIVIKSKEIADGMKAYFDFLWKNASEYEALNKIKKNKKQE